MSTRHSIARALLLSLYVIMMSARWCVHDAGAPAEQLHVAASRLASCLTAVSWCCHAASSVFRIHVYGVRRS